MLKICDISVSPYGICREMCYNGRVSICGPMRGRFPKKPYRVCLPCRPQAFWQKNRSFFASISVGGYSCKKSSTSSKPIPICGGVCICRCTSFCISLWSMWSPTITGPPKRSSTTISPSASISSSPMTAGASCCLSWACFLL